MGGLLAQFLNRLGITQRYSLLAIISLGITFVCWVSLNTIWPDFRLEFDESIALFVIVFLVLLLSRKIIDIIILFIRRWR